MGGANGTQPAGKLVTALFDHDSSRPVAGYAAPQLHTHVVIFI
jgi:TrwC relaxase